MDSKQIHQLMRRTQSYWYEDGLADMAMGIYLLVLGIYFVVQSLTPAGSFLWLFWGVGGPFLLIGGAVVIGWAVKRLKARMVFPRTGYVDYERKGLPQTMRALMAAGVAGGVAGAMVIVSRYGAGLSVFFGLAFAAAFLLVSYRFGLTRYVVLAFASLILGLALAPLALPLERAGCIFFLALGLAMLSAGWMTWRRYDRTAPPPQEALDVHRS